MVTGIVNPCVGGGLDWVIPQVTQVVDDTHWQPFFQDVDLLFPASHHLEQMMPLTWSCHSGNMKSPHSDCFVQLSNPSLAAVKKALVFMISAVFSVRKSVHKWNPLQMNTFIWILLPFQLFILKKKIHVHTVFYSKNYFMCVGVLPACTSVYHLHAWCHRDRKAGWISWPKVKGASCDVSAGTYAGPSGRAASPF